MTKILILTFVVISHYCFGSIIAGKIDNCTSDSLSILLLNGYYTVTADKFNCKVDDDEFHLNLICDRPRFAKLNGLRIYIEPNDSIYLTFDEKNYRKTLTFYHDHNKENTFLFQQSIDHRHWDHLDKPQDFIEQLNRDLELLERNKLNFSDSFYTLHKFDLQYLYLHSAIFKGYAKSIVNKSEEEKLKWEPFLDEWIGSMKLNNPEALESQDYHNYLWWYATYRISFKSKFNEYLEVDGEGLEYAIAQVFLHDLNNEVQEYALGNLLARPDFSTISTEVLLPLINEYKKRYPESIFISKMKSAGNKLSQSQDVKNFTIYQVDRLVSFESFELYLSQMGDKPIYIDFWATWCKPCIQQFKFLPKIKEEFGDRIDYLYISIDDMKNKDRVSQFIERFGLKGHNIILSDKETIQKLGIRGIPRYMIADAKGRIIDSNAPAPSNTNKLLEQLEKALN